MSVSGSTRYLLMLNATYILDGERRCWLVGISLWAALLHYGDAPIAVSAQKKIVAVTVAE